MTFKNVMPPIFHLAFHWYYVSANYGNAIDEFVILSKISIIIEFSFEIFFSCNFFWSKHSYYLFVYFSTIFFLNIKSQLSYQVRLNKWSRFSKNVQVKFVYFASFLNKQNRFQVNEILKYFTFLVNATLKIIYAF